MPDLTLPGFKGPLDLLLRLIEREDLDITEVSLVSVTGQYLEAIRSEESGCDPQLLADFVAIGAKLIYLKSRALLPRPPLDPGWEPVEDDVGQELVDLLVEYRRFATVTDTLQERQENGVRLYPRLASAPDMPEGPGLQGVTARAMQKIMLEVLARVPEPPRAVVPRERVRLVDRVARLRDELRTKGQVSFRRLMSECRNRLEVVVTFLAVLEMLKGGECDAVQAEPWGDIDIVAMRQPAEATTTA
jgi:segregation and condensation protein A